MLNILSPNQWRKLSWLSQSISSLQNSALPSSGPAGLADWEHQVLPPCLLPEQAQHCKSSWPMLPPPACAPLLWSQKDTEEYLPSAVGWHQMEMRGAVTVNWHFPLIEQAYTGCLVCSRREWRTHVLGDQGRITATIFLSQRKGAILDSDRYTISLSPLNLESRFWGSVSGILNTVD